jgi:FRG domain
MPNKQFQRFEPRQWEEFLNIIPTVKDNLGLRGTEECFFRGHGDRTWKLQPTLLREAERRGLGRRAYVELEGDLFWEFQARAQDLHSLNLDDWDYLFFMRHHGVYTRLLDWTEALGVAIYFAIEDHIYGDGSKSSSPCIWVLNPYALNQYEGAWNARDLVSPRYLGYIDDDTILDYGELVEEDGFHWTLPVSIYPIQRSNRVRAQRGWFTIHGKNPRPLEEQAPRVVAQVMLPPKDISKALTFLDQAGLNRYTMYADLDSLAQELHRKNRAVSKLRGRSPQKSKHI